MHPTFCPKLSHGIGLPFIAAASLCSSLAILPTLRATETPANTFHQNLASWYTASSTRYARIYETYEDEQAGHAVTTWDNGTYAQTVPSYAGVQAIAYSANYVYLTTTGLAAGHVMGPWYNDTGPGGSEEVFTNWPESIRSYFRFPVQPTIPTSKTAYPAGAIGLMVDGTVIFSSSDTFSWDNNQDGTGNGSDTGPGPNSTGLGDGIWSHDAYITESNTFDRSNAHCAGNQLHYHAVPMKLRYVLGDSVAAIPQDDGSVSYVENFNGKHSPILGWLADGLPLYGPYGYSDPLDPNSGVRRMVSGFTVRDGNNGTYDIPTNGRKRLPDWAASYQGIGPDLTVNQQGPSNSTIPVPYFMEDYDYKGDLSGFTQYSSASLGDFDESKFYDLNAYNVRWCVTPEFPEGTWAYFTCIDAEGKPTFPYNVAVQYYGDPSSGGNVSQITEDTTSYYVGGPNTAESNRSISVNTPSGDVTLVWNVLEGGTYTVQTSADLNNWNDSLTDQTATDNTLETTDSGVQNSASRQFYRLVRTGLAAYDDGSANAGGQTGGGTGGNNGGGGTVSPNDVIFTATFSGPPLPPQNAISSVTVGGVQAAQFTRDSDTQVTVIFDPTSLASGSYSAQVKFTPPGMTEQTLTSTNKYSRN